MFFICPKCLGKGTLEIIQSLHLPPDSRSDDVVVQILACNQCNHRSGAVYEESRRSGLETEAWEHLGYEVSKVQLDALSALIAGCNEPQNPACPCQVHVLLSAVDSRGRWKLPAGFDRERSFGMDPVYAPGRLD
jgi:hypothetical protein